ncbi:MAG: vacuolar ATPase assembly integral membrane protein vma21 [Stictis urceolatum]|nr:vacuolar ATPase assembly integral membrane protein vma21 [Stictis urceolata]
MTTRRIVSDEKSALSRDDPIPALAPKGKSDITPAVPTNVIVKLLGFTLAMVVAPIGTYFLTLNTVFGGSATWAGATAAIMANVVLVAYVIAAMREDQSERLEAEEKARKGQ